MRSLAPLLLLGFVLLSETSQAEPAAPPPARRKSIALEVDRLHFGITAPWHAKRLGGRLWLGLGWSLPQRWYDADGQLLTERSLLNPGDDLERSGFYLALRF